MGKTRPLLPDDPGFDQRIARLRRASDDLRAEVKRLVAQQRQCVVLAGDALRAQEFDVLRRAEIKGKALDKTIAAELQKIKNLQSQIKAVEVVREYSEQRQLTVGELIKRFTANLSVCPRTY